MSKKNKNVNNVSARVVRIAIRKGGKTVYLTFMPGDNIVSQEDYKLMLENKVGKMYTQEGSVRNRVGKVVKGALLEVSDAEKKVTVEASKSRTPQIPEKKDEKEPTKKDDK